MSQGERWIDLVMAPLSMLGGGPTLPSGVYNRIYEAVGRGTEAQGRALVSALVSALAPEVKGELMPGDRVGYRRAQRLVRGTVVLVNVGGAERLAIVWDGLLERHAQVPVDHVESDGRTVRPDGSRFVVARLEPDDDFSVAGT